MTWVLFTLYSVFGQIRKSLPPFLALRTYYFNVKTELNETANKNGAI